MPRAVLLSAIFLGAFLVFQIQPLIGKRILPWYGGAAAVWTTCLLIFQALLFLGYAYAHLLARLSKGAQAALHGTLLVVAALIPILPADDWKPAGDEDPLTRIASMLLLTIGLPYFVLCASGPLLQSWFWRLHPERSPFPLYALSNAGSLLALLSYPFVFEPVLTGRQQATTWRAGFFAFVLLAGVSAWGMWRRGATLPDAPSSARPSSGQKLLWAGWSACAVILFMSVTNQLTLNVASIPFLWVLPLSLYLFAFILAFSGERAYLRGTYGVLLVGAVVAIVAVLELDLRYAEPGAYNLPILPKLGIYMGALFVLCMVCHGELYRARPAPEHLTVFYLSVAAGGALGGIAVGALAPLLFLLYQELQLGLLLCCGLYLAVRSRGWSRRSVVAAAAGVLALVFATSRQTVLQLEGAVRTHRNFFGLLRIQEVSPGDPALHAFRLMDGAIVHGGQFVRPDLRREPTAYYTRLTGVGHALRIQQRKDNLRIGLVGLGAGTLATYGRTGDSLRFYEINPDVAAVARSHFSFLADSAARSEIVLGDARLRMEQEPDQNYDVLVLDAFSSDSIAVHLLTVEAFETYLRHLRPDGVIALHISNLHLELSTIVYRAAEHHGLFAMEVRNPNRPEQLTMASEWMLLSRDAGFMEALFAELRPLHRSGELAIETRPRAEHADVPAWTDEFSSLWAILR